jgi:hypothetical protein
LLLEIILEKKEPVTARSLLVWSTLLLFANGAYGGVYQRTKDGKTLVWNNYPRQGDAASWSGDRDMNGYATGYGTLTWFRIEPTIETRSNIPFGRRRFFVLSRYSGNMVQGKLNGPVVNIDANGKTFRGKFSMGRKTGDWPGSPAPASERRANERARPGEVVEQPAEGPSPAPDQRSNKRVGGDAIVETPTQRSDSFQSPTPPALLRRPAEAATSAQASTASAPSSSSPSADGVDPAVKNRMISDFKEQIQSVLSRVGEATGNFSEIDRLDLVQKLPQPVSESIGSLVNRARDFRSKLGYEAGALQECRTETETVDALSVVDQITRSIAAKDTSQANSGLANFLKNNPNPTADSQKALWRYLTSVQSLCNQLEKEADTHFQRAQSFSAAGKTSDAIREYKEAYRTFPKPATAEKIRQLQNSSPGL